MPMPYSHYVLAQSVADRAERGQQSGRAEADGIRIDFPVTRQDIAEMTGTTLHTVSRILSAWEERGLVRGGRQKLLVCNPQQLMRVASGDEREVLVEGP